MTNLPPSTPQHKLFFAWLKNVCAYALKQHTSHVVTIFGLLVAFTVYNLAVGMDFEHALLFAICIATGYTLGFVVGVAYELWRKKK